MRSDMENKPLTSSGFTLLEVMITLLILSIGLLGLAALQSTGLKYNLSAYQRTQATVMANNILDRMRANKTRANAGDYSGTPQSHPDCATTTCTPPQIAGYDVDEWQSILSAVLPGGQGTISGPTPVGGTGLLHTITVTWIDDRNATTPTSLSVTVKGEL